VSPRYRSSVADVSCCLLLPELSAPPTHLIQTLALYWEEVIVPTYVERYFEDPRSSGPMPLTLGTWQPRASPSPPTQVSARKSVSGPYRADGRGPSSYEDNPWLPRSLGGIHASLRISSVPELGAIPNTEWTPASRCQNSGFSFVHTTRRTCSPARMTRWNSQQQTT